MNTKLRLTLAAVALVAGSGFPFSGLSVANAQDIEFLGKNGEKVELTPKIEGVPNDRSGARVDKGFPNAALNQPKLGLGNFGDLRGRTFTVTTPDGETKVITADGAQSIIINRSFSSTNDNGDRQIKQGGTAIIVDADGQQYEIDLSQIDEDGDAAKPIEAKPIEVKKSYMIGVFCEPVSPMVRSQLNLDQGVGLTVKRVLDGSPAAEAGVKEFDILMYADDRLLSSINDLTRVVTETGSQEQSFTLTFMRGGEEIPVEVTPSQRAVTASAIPGPMPLLPGLGGFEMNDMGPGLIFDHAFDDRMMERMQNHMQQVRDQMERMDNLLQNQGWPGPGLPMQGGQADEVR